MSAQHFCRPPDKGAVSRRRAGGLASFASEAGNRNPTPLHLSAAYFCRIPGNRLQSFHLKRETAAGKGSRVWAIAKSSVFDP